MGRTSMWPLAPSHSQAPNTDETCSYSRIAESATATAAAPHTQHWASYTLGIYSYTHWGAADAQVQKAGRKVTVQRLSILTHTKDNEQAITETGTAVAGGRFIIFRYADSRVDHQRTVINLRGHVWLRSMLTGLA